MSSHAADQTRELGSLMARLGYAARRPSHRAPEPPVLIDLDEANANLRAAVAEVSEVASGLDRSQWHIALGALVMAGVLVAALIWAVAS